MFEHTSREPGMWRGWLRNGQSLEITWGRTDIGAKIRIHSNDSDMGDRHLWIGLGFIQAFIPIGIVRQTYEVDEEPAWGVSFSTEYTYLRWGRRSRFLDWPFRREMLAWDFEHADGSWVPVKSSFEDGYVDRRQAGKTETHPYTYTLENGKVQRVNATIMRERSVIGRRILHRLGWPKRTKYAIDVEFDGEVGERAGSWKGGCIGCGYDMLPGETPLDTLRRMEREREF